MPSLPRLKPGAPAICDLAHIFPEIISVLRI
jgi:hypothetical protein